MGKTEIGHKRKNSLRPFFPKKNRKDKKNNDLKNLQVNKMMKVSNQKIKF